MNKFDKVYKRIINENPNTTLKKVMYGKHPNIGSFSIVTPENPMGKQLTKKENMERVTEFKKYLKDGRYKYIRVKGSYDGKENPFVIFNISIGNVKKIAKQYNQESFIYAFNKPTQSKTHNVMFEYWEKKGNGDYKKLDKIDAFNFENNAEDYYTRLRSWKFNIPFPIFDSLLSQDVYGKELNENTIHSINNLIAESLVDDTTLTHHYKLRGYINACVNTNKPFEEIGEE